MTDSSSVVVCHCFDDSSSQLLRDIHTRLRKKNEGNMYALLGVFAESYRGENFFHAFHRFPNSFMVYKYSFRLIDSGFLKHF